MVQQGTREEGFEVTTKKTTQVRDSVLAKLCKYNVDHNIIKKTTSTYVKLQNNIKQ